MQAGTKMKGPLGTHLAKPISRMEPVDTNTEWSMSPHLHVLRTHFITQPELYVLFPSDMCIAWTGKNNDDLCSLFAQSALCNCASERRGRPV